jgi:hypothetical protein
VSNINTKNDNDNNNNENNKNESTPVSFPKCPDCDIYMKFYHGMGHIGEADWYYCPNCYKMDLIYHSNENWRY